MVSINRVFSAENADTYGAPVNAVEPDTSIPPAGPQKEHRGSDAGSGELTRVSSPMLRGNAKGTTIPSA